MFKKIKNLFLSFFIRLSISLSKLENEIFKNSKDKLYSGDGSEIDNIQNELLRSLRKGEYNKEYVDKFYKILKASDKVFEADKYSLKDISKKHGMDYGNEDLQYYLNSNTEYNKPNLEERYYIKDGYELENIVKNSIEVLNPLDVLEGKKPIRITKIKSKNINRENKIEEYTEYLHIKKFKGRSKLLEFYINKDINLGNLIEDFKKTDNIYFKSNYGELFDYNISKFIEIDELNSYNILKFKANGI
jgi:hypothetical protein